MGRSRHEFDAGDTARMPPTTLTFHPLTQDRLGDLVELLTSCSWDHFMTARHTPESVRATWDEGEYAGPDNAGHLMLDDMGFVVGVVRTHDLQELTPMFDIRVREEARGRGFGSAGVRWVTDHLFATTDAHRIEAQTRHDNLAMRRTLLRCGYVKEAHYREAYPPVDGVRYDSIGYGVLRSDWERGEVTPVRWEDEPPSDTRGA